MSLEILSKDIFSNADQKVESINAETEQEISVLKVDSEKVLQEFEKKLRARYESETAHLKEQLLGQSHREAKRLILAARSEALEELYEKAQEGLILLDTKKKEALFKKLITKATQEISVAYVYTNPQDVSLVRKLVTKKVTVKNRERMQGLIFETEDHKQILDLSFEALLKDCFAEHDSEIQEVLFR